jgi:hypothetical protein
MFVAPEELMRSLIRVAKILGVLLLACAGVLASPNPSSADDRTSVVIVFKDGHHQSFTSAEIARIDLKTPAAIVYKDGRREKLSADIDRIEFAPAEAATMPGRPHFVGKWEVGEGNGGKFIVTLDADGSARKTLGSPHGTWTFVDGQARITWDDGWQDVICKVGSRYEKRAHGPGTSFDDTPSNVTAARNMHPRPI